MSGEEEIRGFSNYTDIFGDNETIPLRYPTPIIILTYCLYSSVFVACILGNFFVCYVVFSCNGMRTVTNYLIANLAIGDLLLAIVCVPFSFIPLLHQHWPFGVFLCHLLSPAQGVCVFVSAYTLVVIAVDRYMAILYPLKPRLRRSQATVIICIVWIIACIQAAPLAVFTSYTENKTQKGKYVCFEDWGSSDKLRLVYAFALMGLQYVFPVTVLIFTYVRIAFAIWGKRAPGEAEDGRDQRLARAKMKVNTLNLIHVMQKSFTLKSLGVGLMEHQSCFANFYAYPACQRGCDDLFKLCSYCERVSSNAKCEQRSRESKGFTSIYDNIEEEKHLHI